MIETHTTQTNGEAGSIEFDIDFPAVCSRGIAFLAHGCTHNGNNNNHAVIKTFSESLLSCGWLVVRPNFRGAGNSEGQFSEGLGETSDFLRVIDAVFEIREVAERLPAEGQAIFGGFDFGAYVVSLAAQIRKPAAILYAGADVINFDIVHPSCPGFVVHAQKDETVPLESIFTWANNNKLAVTVIPETDHAFTNKLSQLRSVFSQFSALI